MCFPPNARRPRSPSLVGLLLCQRIFLWPAGGKQDSPLQRRSEDHGSLGWSLAPPIHACGCHPSSLARRSLFVHRRLQGPNRRCPILALRTFPRPGGFVLLTKKQKKPTRFSGSLERAGPARAR